MRKLLFDSDYLIDYFRGQNLANTLVDQVRKRKIEGYMSVISLYELFVGILGNKEANRKIQELYTVKNWFFIHPVGEQTCYKAAQISAHMKNIKEQVSFRDLLIAATAITHNLPLKTRNKKDFEKIPEVKLA